MAIEQTENKSCQGSQIVGWVGLIDAVTSAAGLMHAPRICTLSTIRPRTSDENKNQIKGRIRVQRSCRGHREAQVASNPYLILVETVDQDEQEWERS